MDIKNTKFKYRCKKHRDFKLEFMQVDQLDEQHKGKEFFYCTACVNEDLSYKHQNYQLIQEIIKSGNNQIIYKWPQINDQQTIKQLIQISNEQDYVKNIQEQIDQYFTDLKQEICKQIDICHKSMIKQAQELPQNKNQILSRYQEISKIEELRSYLVDDKTDIDEKQKKCKVLIEKIASQKEKITEQLTSLLNQQLIQQANFNCLSAVLIKQSILQNISSINFFEKPIIKENINNDNNNSLQQLDFELIQTKQGDGFNCSVLTKKANNQFEVSIQKQDCGWQNIVSNIILDREKKYIFRIKIQNLEKYNTIYIGLMKDSNINDIGGQKDKMCCWMYNDSSYLSKFETNYGIYSQIKGDKFVLTKENIIEMRVCLNDQILQLFDYPKYQYGIEIDDKNELINNQKLRFYLGIGQFNTKIELKEVLIVDKFD